MDKLLQNFINKSRKLPVFNTMLRPPHKQFPLHLIITSCGHDIVTSHTYSHNGLKRGNKCFGFIQFTLNGKGKLIFENKFYDVKQGEVFIGTIPHNHKYFLPKSSSLWEFVYLTFAGSEAIRLLKTIQREYGPVFTFKSTESLAIFDEILYLTQKSLPNIFSLSSLGYSFLMSLISQLYQPALNITHRKIIQAMTYCKNNYHLSLKIETIANHLNISQFHLARLFHKEVGTTIQQFIESYRVQKALDKIINTNSSIKTIARECGFSTSSYFTQVFKKHYGESPSLFKKQMFY